MNTNCPEIDLAVKLSEDTGNKVSQVSFGWSAVNKDISMCNYFDSQLKEKIKSEITTLEYWNSVTDSHYEPEEGFLCKEHRVSISFPALMQYPR